uniref:B30.2/SPRY domain-containing protein n=2 Tax=Globodera rostochiensis TaxID=31243 RepID=A0A914H6X2_GLORO
MFQFNSGLRFDRLLNNKIKLINRPSWNRKTLLITQQNQWNSAACHDELALIEPDRLIVQFTGKKWGQRSVLAERPIPKKDFGLSSTNFISIGLGTKQMPFDNPVGWYNGTCGYDSQGSIWSEMVEGCSHWKEAPFNWGKPSFGVGDVIGCGVDLATRQIIYTKNGQRLGTAGFCVDSAADLFPCVTLFDAGTKIEANFGPNFKLNITADGI